MAAENSFAADVGDGESQAAAGPLQDVVVISANSPGGNTNGGELEASVGRKLLREKRLLYLQSEVQFRFLARQFVAAGPQFELHAIKHHPQHRRSRSSRERQAERRIGGHGDIATAHIEQQPCSHQENQKVEAVAHGWIQSDLSLKG